MSIRDAMLEEKIAEVERLKELLASSRKEIEQLRLVVAAHAARLVNK